MSNRRIDRTLTLAELMLSNAVDPEVAPLLEPYGDNAARLAEGQTRLTNTRQTLSRREALRGIQRERTRQAQAAQRAARRQYIALVTVARTIFKDRPGLLVQLGIEGDSPDSFASLLQAGMTLFDNVTDPEIAAELAKYGYPAERIAELRAAFDALRQAKQAQEAAKGDTQQATQDLNAALEELEDWISRFRVVARDALRDFPQYLEKLGILSRS